MAHITSFHSWFGAQTALGRRTHRTIGHNTTLESVPAAEGTDFVVRLHGHPIARFYTDGRIELSSCGWPTVTTKDRLNQLLPPGFAVVQERRQWYLVQAGPDGRLWSEGSTRYGWADGITLQPENGRTAGAWTVLYAAGEGVVQDEQRQRKAVARYAKAYVKALLDGQVPAPSSGDCWYCAFEVRGGAQDGQGLGEAVGDTSHLTNHISESYFVPALLYRVLDSRWGQRLSPVARQAIACAWHGELEQARTWGRVTGNQIEAALRDYLLHQFGLG